LRTDFFKKSSAARHRDGYFGAAEVQRIYSSAIDASAKALGGSRTSPVEVAAGTIAKALTARRPVARYVVGFEARVGLRILPRFPVRLRDQLLMSSLGLGRDAFTAPSLSAKE